MKRTAKTLWMLMLAFLLGAGPAAAKHLKVFVLTGQSNSLGTTAGSEADPTSGSDPADQHVLFFWHNRANATTSLGDSGGVFTTLQDQQGGYYTGSATHWGPEIAFARTLYRAGVRDFAVVKASRGGGGNTFWLKGSGDDHMYQHVVATVGGAAAALTGAGHTFDLSGLLYVQGESDNAAEANVAGDRFKMLVDNLRVDLPNASALHGVIGGIAAAGGNRDTVRIRHQAAATSTAYIDYFSNLDLQPKLYDSLHFNKAAKITVGDRFAQAFLSTGIVTRHYGQLVFIGDSITQGGNGDHRSYRYQVFSHLANRGVPIDVTNGYRFVGSVAGAYKNSLLTVPDVNGQAFENVHDGHWGWRARWINARVALPAGRYDVNNLGRGTLLNWTGHTNTFETADAGTLIWSGTNYTPDTVCIMVGINDLADGIDPTQVRDDLGTLIDQLRTSNPAVRIHLNKVLHTDQGEPRNTQVNTLNALLPALVADRNTASTNSPVWLVDADTGFNPSIQTYDNVHPNASGEAYVGDRIAASLGLLETPEPAQSVSPPPHIEAGSAVFASRFEGHEIWNGTGYSNSWTQVSTLTKNLPSPTDLRLVNPGGGGAWIEGTATGWNTDNDASWTLETRIQCNDVSNGFIFWLGTDTRRILVEVYNDRTTDNGSQIFTAMHNNADGAFHVFRIAHDAGNATYHVWRDGVRLTPVEGIGYDATASDSRLLLGDYTSGGFGNNFDVTIDYLRYDQTGAYLPIGADADTDGLPDSWEYNYYNNGGAYTSLVLALTSASAISDDDADGASNIHEYVANTDPHDIDSVLRINGLRQISEYVFNTILKSSAQRNYTLLKTPDITEMPVTWTPIDGPVIGTDGPLVLQDGGVNETSAYYRVRVALP